MANREFYDLIIIGGGPGGFSAAIYALRASMRTFLLKKRLREDRSPSPMRWKIIRRSKRGIRCVQQC